MSIHSRRSLPDSGFSTPPPEYTSQDTQRPPPYKQNTPYRTPPSYQRATIDPRDISLQTHKADVKLNQDCNQMHVKWTCPKNGENYFRIIENFDCGSEDSFNLHTIRHFRCGSCNQSVLTGVLQHEYTSYYSKRKNEIRTEYYCPFYDTIAGKVAEGDEPRREAMQCVYCGSGLLSWDGLRIFKMVIDKCRNSIRWNGAFSVNLGYADPFGRNPSTNIFSPAKLRGSVFMCFSTVFICSIHSSKLVFASESAEEMTTGWIMVNY
ncbi:hypothetical protein HYFRA_00011375 [Hymenoscyphus fraxineus]|uniref:Uncharacterized protein n=1 Tax=Hymenoscyphus fraxineus TaxID=746836 RepID=A0A9N9KWW9_9HELO|nr:hypothetical protein HYFRA_00011375 [Hymenoscyphus fraxineus]